MTAPTRRATGALGLVAACLALGAALPAQARGAWSPAVLPRIASELAGRPVDVRCLDDAEWRTLVAERGPQAGPGAASAQTGTVELRAVVCEVLLGFAVAQPHGPEPRTRAGFVVADYARFLTRLAGRARGVADPAAAECFALASMQTTLELLGAERRYARKLGGWLLDRRAQRPPAAALPADCPVRAPAPARG
jgi:hypothetical protein